MINASFGSWTVQSLGLRHSDAHFYSSICSAIREYFHEQRASNGPKWHSMQRHRLFKHSLHTQVGPPRKRVRARAVLIWRFIALSCFLTVFAWSLSSLLPRALHNISGALTGKIGHDQQDRNELHREDGEDDSTLQTLLAGSVSAHVDADLALQIGGASATLPNL